MCRFAQGPSVDFFRVDDHVPVVVGSGQRVVLGGQRCSRDRAGRPSPSVSVVAFASVSNASVPSATPSPSQSVLNWHPASSSASSTVSPSSSASDSSYAPSPSKSVIPLESSGHSSAWSSVPSPSSSASELSPTPSPSVSVVSDASSGNVPSSSAVPSTSSSGSESPSQRPSPSGQCIRSGPRGTGPMGWVCCPCPRRCPARRRSGRHPCRLRVRSVHRVACRSTCPDVAVGRFVIVGVIVIVVVCVRVVANTITVEVVVSSGLVGNTSVRSPTPSPSQSVLAAQAHAGPGPVIVRSSADPLSRCSRIPRRRRSRKRESSRSWSCSCLGPSAFVVVVIEVKLSARPRPGPHRHQCSCRHRCRCRWSPCLWVSPSRPSAQPQVVSLVSQESSLSSSMSR